MSPFEGPSDGRKSDSFIKSAEPDFEAVSTSSESSESSESCESSEGCECEDEVAGRRVRFYGTVDTEPDEHTAPVHDKESNIPPADHGKAAWLFLTGCFWLEGLVWGEQPPSVFTGITTDTTLPRYPVIRIDG